MRELIKKIYRMLKPHDDTPVLCISEPMLADSSATILKSQNRGVI